MLIEGALEYSQSIGMKMLALALLKLVCTGHMNMVEGKQIAQHLSGQGKYGGKAIANPFKANWNEQIHKALGSEQKTTG